MRIIHRYDIYPGRNTIKVPVDNQILFVGYKPNSTTASVWIEVLVSPITEDEDTIILEAFPTGVSIPEYSTYIGSFITEDSLVFHIYRMLK